MYRPNPSGKNARLGGIYGRFSASIFPSVSRVSEEDPLTAFGFANTSSHDSMTIASSENLPQTRS